MLPEINEDQGGTLRRIHEAERKAATPQEPNQYEDKEFSYGVDMGSPDGDYTALSVIVDGTAYIWNGKEAEAILQLITQKQLEARIDELTKHREQWAVWEDDTTDVKLADVLNWYDLRIDELTKQKGKG